MGYLPAYAALLVGVLGLSKLCADAVDWAASGEPPGYLRPLLPNRSTTPPPTPVDPLPIRELSRLSQELARVRAAAQPGLALRLRAVTMAYDEALLRCAESLQLPVPGHRAPLPEPVRFELEAQLIGRGLSW